MDYRKLIREFMKADTQGNANFIEWVKTFPEMQQVALMRELNVMTEEMAAEQGFNMKDFISDYEKANEKYDAFEDAILNKRILEDFIKSVKEKKEMQKAKMINDIKENKIFVISSILNNAPNAFKMKKLAEMMISIEKKFGIHDPKTWEGIE
jgi:hypothetical protein